MGDSKLQSLVEQAAAEILNRALPDLREKLVRQVCEQMQAQEPESPAVPESSRLNTAMAAIQTGNTQVEILDALIEGASQFAARCVLYVVRGDRAVGWRAHGFQDNDSVRNTPLDLKEGFASHAVQSRELVSGPAAQFAPGFSQKFGAPNSDVIALPLTVRDKVVGLLYADSGLASPFMDGSAIQALARVAGLWLEVFASRKASGLAERAHSAPQAMAAAAPAHSAPAPAPVMGPPVPEPEPQPAAAPGTSSAHPASSHAEEDEVVKKARRFAKLLVDEIKLYNQAKVNEGRQNRDLYDRLKEDIEKSRASYEKRYGETAAKQGDYFNQELVRILADNDRSLLGSNFPQ